MELMRYLLHSKPVIMIGKGRKEALNPSRVGVFFCPDVFEFRSTYPDGRNQASIPPSQMMQVPVV